MRASIKDVDFSFEQAANDRERLRNPNRSTVASHNPEGKPRSVPWKVVTGPAEQTQWTIERPPGMPVAFTENRPSAVQIIDRLTGNPSTSVFKMRIVEPCLIASQCAEVGDLVTAFAGTAADLIGLGRVEVIEEIRHGKK
ncbi:hypothetical protein HQ447_07330 [bacterium]|nr:hypothetical protein [bacterium]